MVAHRISRFSGEFASTAEEQAYLAEIWPQTVLYLRIITIITILGMLFSFYLYYLLFGTGYQFQVLCLSVIAVIFFVIGLYLLTYQDSYTPPARLLTLFAQLLFSVNQLLGHHFLLVGSLVHSEVGMPFIIAIIMVYYAFIPNQTYKILLATSFASLTFLLYYIFSPLIPFQSILMLFLELLAVNAVGYLFLVNWNRLRRMEFVHRKKLEDEVLKRIEAEKLARKVSAAKTRFLASASHDLRQPLQAQRFYVETMVAQAKDASVRRLGDKAIFSQRAMQKMLDTLLDLSRLDAGMMSPCFADISLKLLFSRMRREFSPLADKKGLIFCLHWPADDAVVRSDPNMLESMLRNLIANAIRYTDTGRVMLAVRSRGSYWRIEVRDSGRGIAKEQQQEIFEEFHQLGNPERDREKGLGLGLSIVRRLARLLEHELSLFSRPGRGSVFALRLPVGRSPVFAEAHFSDGFLPDFSGYHVLIIDDEFAIRDAMSSALEYYACSVAQAADRDEAELMVQKQLPDVMVVDYRLARGENGIEVIKYLNNSAGVDIPALLLTGDTSADVLQIIERSGISALHKPVDPKELIRFLSEILEKSS